MMARYKKKCNVGRRVKGAALKKKQKRKAQELNDIAGPKFETVPEKNSSKSGRPITFKKTENDQMEENKVKQEVISKSVSQACGSGEALTPWRTRRGATLAQEPLAPVKDDPKVPTATRVVRERTRKRQAKGVSSAMASLDTSPRNTTPEPQEEDIGDEPQEENKYEPQDQNRGEPTVTSGIQVAVARSSVPSADLASEAGSLLTGIEHNYARNWEIQDRGPVPVIIVEKRPNQGPLPVFLVQNKHMGEGSTGLENLASISGMNSQTNRQDVLGTSNTNNIPNPFNSLSTVGTHHLPYSGEVVKSSDKEPSANSYVRHVETRVRMEPESHVREEVCEFETIECETGVPVPYGPHYPQEYLDLGNQLRATTLPGNFEARQKSCAIYITDYHTKGPHIVIRISVAITLNFEAKVGVYQTQLPSGHDLWKALPTKYETVSSITGLLKKLSSYAVCEGIVDQEYLDFFSSTSRNRSNHSNRAQPAYRDTNVMYDTIRSVRCRLLTFGPPCYRCNAYRAKMKKAMSRQKDMPPPSKFTSLVNLSHDQLCKKVKTNDIEMKRLLAHASKLETALKLYVGKDVNVNEDGLTGKQNDSPALTDSTAAAVGGTLNSLGEHPIAVGEPFSVLPPGGTTHHSGVLSPGGSTHHSRALSLGGTTHHSGVQSPGGSTHHSGDQSPGGTTHHSGDLSLPEEDAGLEDTSSGRYNDIDGHKSEMKSVAKIAAGKSPQGTTSYRCHVCRRRFIKLASLVIHIKSKTCLKTFNCDVCSQKFQNVVDLHSHKKTHILSKPCHIHTGERPFHCQTCGKTYIHLQDLRAHKLKHTIDPTSEKSLACEICGQKFHLQKQLSCHKSKKHKERKIRKCEVCSKEFLSTVALTKHTRIHTGEKPFLCAVCGKSFRTFAHFHTHRRRHTGEKPYKCSNCNKAFADQTNYRNHLLKHSGETAFLQHTGFTPFVCSTCGKQLSTKRGLTFHEMVHTGERPYQCDICGKGFIQAGSLKTHMFSHTGKSPFQCNVCGKACWSPKDLKVHSLKHTGERPCHCDVCGKGFTTAHILKAHKRLHTGERPYKCTLCGKGFTDSNNLGKHKRLKHVDIAE